jgi:hypothetical protein
MKYLENPKQSPFVTVGKPQPIPLRQKELREREGRQAILLW